MGKALRVSVLNFPEPKDMREQIETLMHCQNQTNETLGKIVEALSQLSVWMKQQESINRENNKKLELIMKAIKYSLPT